MNKTKLLSELHTIIATRLRGAWLVKDESQLSSALRALDLVLRPENQGAGAGHLIGPKKSRTKSRSKPRPIPLGEKINFELLSVFMGTRSLRDVPGILKKNGLITETDFDECRTMAQLRRSGDGREKPRPKGVFPVAGPNVGIKQPFAVITCAFDGFGI